MKRRKYRHGFSLSETLVAFIVFIIVSVILVGLTVTVKKADVSDIDYVMLTESENVFERFKADQTVLNAVDKDDSENRIVADLYYNEKGEMICFNTEGIPIRDTELKNLASRNFSIEKTDELALSETTLFGKYKYVLHIEVDIEEKKESGSRERYVTYSYSFSLNKENGRKLFVTDEPQLVITTPSKYEYDVDL